MSFPEAGTVSGVTRMQLWLHLLKFWVADGEKMMSSEPRGSSTLLCTLQALLSRRSIAETCHGAQSQHPSKTRVMQLSAAHLWAARLRRAKSLASNIVTVGRSLKDKQVLWDDCWGAKSPQPHKASISEFQWRCLLKSLHSRKLLQQTDCCIGTRIQVKHRMWKCQKQKCLRSPLVT